MRAIPGAFCCDNRPDHRLEAAPKTGIFSRVVHFMASGTSGAEFLGWDDAFLEDVAGGGPETVWFWEADAPFVVIGRGQRVDREVHRSACEQDGIPIYRRCSGGGAVVQGPGCLNYGLALRIPESGPLTTLSTTNQWIMARQASALARAGIPGVVVRGHTDLALSRGETDLKFSGNAQRRLKDALLFHGTLLLGADLSGVNRWLAHPSSEPGYRAGRGHLDFIANLGISPDQIRAAIVEEWDAGCPHPGPPHPAMEQWAFSRYSLPEWNLAR